MKIAKRRGLKEAAWRLPDGTPLSCTPCCVMVLCSNLKMRQKRFASGETQTLIRGGVPRGNAGTDDLRRWPDGCNSPPRVNATCGLVRPDTARPPHGLLSADRFLKPSREHTAKLLKLTEPHRWPCHGFGDCWHLSRIVLATLHAGFDIGRQHKPGGRETALLDRHQLAIPEQPLEVLRTTHYLDPRMACAAHQFGPERTEVASRWGR
jgi:hypothetical protein